ncbi:MAG: hypothetical protein ABSH20_06030 [Tepidisphaeraceae bacterium]|jgi:hypothetical protein
MKKKPKTLPEIPKLYVDPEPARRNVAAAYREEAGSPKWTPAERAEFGRMADSWERTLPKEK